MRLLSSVGALLITALSSAAPALVEKPVRYKYAELQCHRYLRGAAPLPGQKAVAMAPVVEIRWVTADEEVSAAEWADLADKLKVPAAKKEATALMHRLRVFRRLGEDGWEVIEHTGTDGTRGESTWTFRRKVP